MRYGNPSLDSRLDALVKLGCERIVLLPLYPQYAGATTATVCDAAFASLARMRFQPALRVVPPYYDEPLYIEALAVSIEEELTRLAFEPEIILASFHGIPKSYAEEGDPYPQQCAETVRLLRERLGLDEQRFMLTFQSRFGRAEWIKPYTDETVRSLAQGGVHNLAVVTPGFAADCLETLEEIAVENCEIFKANGGTNFAAIPCLNDSEWGMRLLVHLVRRELQGWV
jgi:protoporphyrin/coproporphyrin ferrochelatase